MPVFGFWAVCPVLSFRCAASDEEKFLYVYLIHNNVYQIKDP